MRTAYTKADIVRLAEEFYLDPVLACKTLLPSWFPGRMPWHERGVLAILLRKTNFLWKYGELDKIFRHFVYKVDPTDESENAETAPLFEIQEDGSISLASSPHMLMEIFRGASKTTLINAALILLIAFKELNYGLYLSETSTHACTQLGSVKRQYETNDLLRLVFGDLVPDRQSSAKWTSDFLEFANGAILAGRGRGGQVRGSLVDAKRPDFIAVDDVEDEESVKTEEQRKTVRKWFYEAVMPALDFVHSDEARIVAAGTPLHKEALLQVLKKDPEWTTVSFGAVDSDGEALWPEVLPLERLARIKLSFQLAGNLEGYYREYHVAFKSFEGSLFRPEFFFYANHDANWHFISKALTCDPAISKDKKACHCAYGVVAMTGQGQKVVLDAYGKIGMETMEQADKFFELDIKWNPTLRGIESVAYQGALISLIRTEMFRRHRYFQIIPITKDRGDKPKIEHIKGILQGQYAAGYIIHWQHFPLYEMHLLEFPNGPLDIPDAIAMAVKLLDPYAGVVATEDIFKDIYPPLGVCGEAIP